MGKIKHNANDAVKWQISPSVKGRENLFLLKDVHCDKVIKDWRHSLFAHEWLDENGRIKTIDKMSDGERAKRQEVSVNIKHAHPLPYPVLGIGIQENIEIGSGRAIFLTLAAEGYKTLPVYIPKSCLGEFKTFLA